MRSLLTIYFCLCASFSSCIEEPTKKIYIKSVEGPNGMRIDWYVYSKLTSFTPDYLQINTPESNPFFKSFYLTDIHFQNDSLLISLWSNKYDLEWTTLSSPPLKVVVDTLGQPWNDATSRIGRLRNRGVNMDKPHFVDTYCARGECEKKSVPRYSADQKR